MRTAFLALLTFPLCAAEPEWDLARIKPCDRSCLVGIMDGYLNAIYQHNRI
ncbi:MAG: hypothetical protein JO336_20805 [Acidobacteriia bacterium]|nr:hypothetical protein [Terriglobia bacterium]